MINHFETAKSICEYFKEFPEVKNCKLYGSLYNGNYDEYSDIDVEIDVSGIDNGKFLKRVPIFLSEIYPVIFSDYAPSLLPDEYVVSCAISSDNPFLIADIKCVAKPHIRSITKQDLINDKDIHILKLWVANTKHYLRGQACDDDIKKMYRKVFGDNRYSVRTMLLDVLEYLKSHCDSNLAEYINSCEKYSKRV